MDQTDKIIYWVSSELQNYVGQIFDTLKQNQK